MSAKPTRDALGDELLALGLERKDVFVIDCDVSKSCKTIPFSQQCANQHVNVGISEQNAVGIAAGMATTGKVPFVVTYAAFGSMRACEQIRQEVCYPKLNVKIACSHGGLTPANDGASHQCIEDMGIMRTLPNMTVIMPADYHSARALIRAAADYQGPVYLRFTRDPIDEVYDEGVSLEIGKAHQLQDGTDVAILANGDTVNIAAKAAKQLEAEGVSVRLLDFHTIKPLDVDAVKAALTECGSVLTVEDHNILNGLGSAVCEVAAELGQGKVKRIGVQDCFGESAPYEVLLQKNGISVEHICEEARRLINKEN